MNGKQVSHLFPVLFGVVLTGHIHGIINGLHKTPPSSAYLVELCDTEENDAVALMARQCLSNVLDLSQDIFANVAFRRFLDVPDPDFRTACAEQVKGHIFELSKHDHGCRVSFFPLRISSVRSKDFIAQHW